LGRKLEEASTYLLVEEREKGADSTIKFVFCKREKVGNRALTTRKREERGTYFQEIAGRSADEGKLKIYSRFRGARWKKKKREELNYPTIINPRKEKLGRTIFLPVGPFEKGRKRRGEQGLFLIRIFPVSSTREKGK